MKFHAAILLTAVLSASVAAQQPQRQTGNAGLATVPPNSLADLPIEKIGNDDLIGVTVYDSPELTRTVRVDSAGEIRIPMVQQHIKVAGLYPSDIEKAIATTLVKENVLVDPIVTVNVVEYRSRPISVVGAVRSPLTFQATGSVKLLDAIAQAGGLTENAGSEILVSQQALGDDGNKALQVQKIPVRGLIDAIDPALNVVLHGGEEVRVPEAGKVYVLGNVHKPGAFTITDEAESTVLKALALSEGLDHYSGHVAYIYRAKRVGASAQEIPIELNKIIKRKAPDVPLMANDILYVPEATGRKATLTALDRISMIGSSVGTTLLYVYH